MLDVIQLSLAESKTVIISLMYLRLVLAPYILMGTTNESPILLTKYISINYASGICDLTDLIILFTLTRCRQTATKRTHQENT